MSSSPSSDRAAAAAAEAAVLPVYEDVLEAAARLEDKTLRTPLLESPALNELAGGRLLVKAEALQRTGSFKFRGAFNRLSRLDAAARRRGVVAYSSGNHAQGVAAAAAMLGIQATIAMPRDAPQVKLAGTRRHGAEIVFYDRQADARERLAEAIAAKRGATMIRPYDDRYIIAGQGTVGLEISEQAAELGAAPEAVLIPAGGGGLSAGCALALAERLPETRIYTVEPEEFDDHARSLAAGRRLENAADRRSICDALLSPTPGELTFAINRQRLAGGLTVSDAEVMRAMALAFTHLKIVVEPSGAVALAAALSDRFDCARRTVAVVCSGGNADAAMFIRALETVAEAD